MAVLKLLAVRPLNVIVSALVVFDRVTVPAATEPEKLAPPELLMVKFPAPVKLLPEIAPPVPPFRVKALPPLLTAPSVIAAPAGVLFVVSIVTLAAPKFVLMLVTPNVPPEVR